MTNRLRIAHCSDIHLDADSLDINFHREAFQRMLGEIYKYTPDLLLLAGDIFDANTASDDTIRWTMTTLAEQPYPIAMIPGNHDCLQGDSIYKRYDFDKIANVNMLTSPTGELRSIESLEVAIWAKGMVDHSPDHRPLVGAPERPRGCRWYLGMGHGLYVPEGQSTTRSSPIPHQEVIKAPFHYLALGHHHAAFTIETERGMAAFCGSPTDTVGGDATYAIAELSAEGTQVKILNLPL